MPKKSNKRRMMLRMKTRMKTKTRNQKPVLMIGCSVPKVNTKNYLSLGNKSLKHRYKYKKLLGGLGCGSSGCPISPLSTEKMLQLGGTCQTCSNMQLGGKIPPPPPPFVPANSAWGPSVNKWPGVDGPRNYLSPYNTNNDPQLQMSMNNAGYNTKNSLVGGKKNKKIGGGIMPQDLVNLGRDYTYNFKSTYNALNGYKAPVDPAPYKGQLTGSLVHNGFFS
jgi:hypothetical protein